MRRTECKSKAECSRIKDEGESKMNQIEKKIQWWNPAVFALLYKDRAEVNHSILNTRRASELLSDHLLPMLESTTV